MTNQTNSDMRHDELRPIMNQSQVELEMLAFAKAGLMAALEWRTEGDTFTRKLSSLRFAAKTYQDHLERTLALEEHDGFMDFVVEACPQFDEKVRQLRSEHDDFRHQWDAIIAKLDRLLPTDHDGLGTIRIEIGGLLGKLKSHCERETTLMQDSVLLDLGSSE